MDAFALASSSRLESAGWTHRRVVPRAPRETTKAAVASSSLGPLQKGELWPLKVNFSELLLTLLPAHDRPRLPLLQAAQVRPPNSPLNFLLR